MSKNKSPRNIALIFFTLLLLPVISPDVLPASGQVHNNKEYNVGYTVLDLPYQGSKSKTLTVAVWYPTTEAPKKYNYGESVNGLIAPDAPPDPAGGPYPLLVFSHGYGGSGLSAVFLVEKLAARGWIVAAPDHSDRDSAVRIRTGRNKRLDRSDFLQHAQEITRSGPDDRGKYLYRIDELKSVLDQMLTSEKFGMLIDKNRIAVGGHSFGGFTALGLCGTIEDRRDERIKAVLLFSTGAGAYLYRESELARVKIPSLYMFGEREKKQKRGKKTMEELAEKVYTNLPAPKYLLVLKRGNHYSFNNRFTDRPGTKFLGGSEEQFEVIRRYSIAFLEKYVAGKEDAGNVLEQQDPLLVSYKRETRN